MVSAMPIVLHPLILFALTAGVNPMSLLLAVLIGRFCKYGLMGAFAITGSGMMRFFGNAAVQASQQHQKQP